MRIKRTMRSSSSTTRIRRRSKDSDILFPHETDDLFLFRTFQDLDKLHLGQDPDHFGNIVFKIVQVLAIALPRVHDDNNIIGWLWQFFDLPGNRWLARYV